MFKTYEELFTAYKAFRQGKKLSYSLADFEYNLVPNLRELAAEIDNHTYHHGNYRILTVREKKRRDLAIACIRDRVVHRYVYDYLVGLFDTNFDPDVWSCRRGKGLHACLARTQQLLKCYPRAYAWRTDITKFFDHVDHHVLRQCLKRRVQNCEMLWLCDEIISSYHLRGGATYWYSDWQFNQPNFC
ncbi:hypothetical protein FWF48_03235 [Candidatus Saccharibacteria bacterium]|nr:hypothetical protein [Candidatus Saccharibacteria bacterium]